MKDTGTVHIDKIRVLGPCKHKPIGGAWYSVDEGTGALRPIAASPQRRVLGEGTGAVRIHSKGIGEDGMASQLLIECCPPLVLQRHNWCGHASLGDYTYAVFDHAIKAFGVTVEQEDRRAWKSGSVHVTEIHLTANFRCPASQVKSVIDSIDANNGAGKHRNGINMISLGWPPGRRSKYHLLSIYYKRDELQRRFGPNPGSVRRRLLAEAKDAVRAEIKLFSQFLKRQGLNTVSAWLGINVDGLYFQTLSKYGINYPVQRRLTDDELEVLNDAEKRVYLLWLAGEDLNKQFKSRTTANKYAKVIKEKTEVDIRARRRPAALPDLNLAKIFHHSNSLGVPDWLKGTEFYHSPS